jgi:3-hydroxyisobutyrate dehydrogenase
VKPTVALLGTGIMGTGMGVNLRRAGHEVRAWNRTADRAAEVGEEGAQLVQTPREAAAGADVVVTMLADADAVEHVMCGDDGGLFAMREDAVWAQMSTVGLVGTDTLAAIAAEAAVAYVDAPVLGTRQPAEAGELVVLASGPQAARAACEPVFEAVGRQTRWLGEAPGVATRAKLVLNSWVLALTEATAETITLARALGVDPDLFLESIKGGPLDAGYAQLKGRAMIDDKTHDASFPLALARKDADLIREAAAAEHLALPLVDAIAAQFARAQDLGLGDEDMAATVRALAPS